jgi:hypothetical protein
MFVSGCVENDALTPWLAQGVATISKPCTQPDLSRAVRQAIEQQSAARPRPDPAPAQLNAANSSSNAFN